MNAPRQNPTNLPADATGRRCAQGKGLNPEAGGGQGEGERAMCGADCDVDLSWHSVHICTAPHERRLGFAQVFRDRYFEPLDRCPYKSSLNWKFQVFTYGKPRFFYFFPDIEMLAKVGKLLLNGWGDLVPGDILLLLPTHFQQRRILSPGLKFYRTFRKTFFYQPATHLPADKFLHP